MSNTSAPMLFDSWTRLWWGLGCSGDGVAARNELISACSLPPRRYHTIQHLEECLSAFESVRHLAAAPFEVEAAIWFHDAVYLIPWDDNEQQSALLAYTRLTDGGANQIIASRITNMILATDHHREPATPDQRLMVDIDLAILGAEPARFTQYEQQVRREYESVPDEVFNAKRRALLTHFLSRNEIYKTKHFRELLEARARANIRSAIDRIPEGRDYKLEEALRPTL